MVALDDFPAGEQAGALQRAGIDYLRSYSSCAEICVSPDGADGSIVDIWLHNEFSAHDWPSGATQDRRAWLELHVYAGSDEVLRAGVVPDGVPLDAVDDPLLWWFGGHMFDEAGQEVHMFWEARRTEPVQLPASRMFSPLGDASTWRGRRYHVPAVVDRVTTAVRLRPVSLTVLDELVESGDLDPAVRDAVPTFTLPPTELEWTRAAAVTLPPYGVCVSSAVGVGCGASVAQADALE